MLEHQSKWRAYFPFFEHTEAQEEALYYLDNAATSQVCDVVLRSVHDFEARGRSNVHRGVYPLSERATLQFENARAQVARFLNAKSPNNVVFTHGCTEALNLVAQCYLRSRLKPGDAICITLMEHHANIVPWQALARQLGCVLKVVPLTDEGTLDLAVLEKIMREERVKLFSFVHISNVLGTINPLAEIMQIAKGAGVPVCVDGAQSATHMCLDVQKWDVDFYVLSGHKMFAPFGVGALYAKTEHLEVMEPYQLGGHMIEQVTFEKTTYAKPPARFEAGTSPISGAIGLGMACDFIKSLDMQSILEYEVSLGKYLDEGLRSFPGVKVLGSKENKAPITSFMMRGAHAHDIATILGAKGVCVRAGHHCTMPLMAHYGAGATTRVSLMCYNTKAEVDAFFNALHHVRKVFNG